MVSLIYLTLAIISFIYVAIDGYILSTKEKPSVAEFVLWLFAVDLFLFSFFQYLLLPYRGILITFSP